MTAKILSISEQTEYGNMRRGLERTDKQVFWIEIGTDQAGGQLVDKKVASTLVASDKRLPQPFDKYKLADNMYAGKCELDQMKEVPNVWIYKVEWNTITNPQEAIPDPADRPVLITTGTYKQQEYPSVDLDNKPVCNTAGEPILYTQQKSYPTYTFEKNYAEYPKQFALLRDMVNSDDVFIFKEKFPPYTLFCPEVSISHIQYEGKYSFYALSATMYANGLKDRKGNIIGWRTLLRNQGFHEKKDTGEFEKKKNGLPNTKKPIYALQAIQIGTIGRPAYPTSPILLTPGGRAFREKLPKDPDDIEKYTGKVIGVNIPGEPVVTAGITVQQFDDAVVECRFNNVIRFNDYFPFK